VEQLSLGLLFVSGSSDRIQAKGIASSGSRKVAFLVPNRFVETLHHHPIRQTMVCAAARPKL